MRDLRSLSALALLVTTICAHSEEKVPSCESPETGAELIACAAARHKAADVRLNGAYKQLRDALRRNQESLLEERLKIAQRDWLKFQRSHCDLASTYEGAGGSFSSAKFGECMAETTDERAKYLEEMLSYFK